MQSEHTFARNEVLPSWFPNALQPFLSGAVFGLNLSLLDPTHIQIVAGANDQAAIAGIGGSWRWIEASISRAHPGGAAGVYDIYLTAAADSIISTPAPYTDATNRAFALAILASGATPTIVPGTVDIFRKVGSCYWNGSRIAGLTQTVGAPPLARPMISTALTANAMPGDSFLLTGGAGINLPLASSCPGQTVEVHAGPTITTFVECPINAAGSDLIYGPGVKGTGVYGYTRIYVSNPGAFVVLRSDGTNWQITAGGQDTGWGNLQYVGTFATPTGYRRVQARIVGTRVEFRGAVQNPGSGTVGGPFLLGPAGFLVAAYEPQSTIVIPGSGGYFLSAGSASINTPAGGMAAGAILSLEGFWYDNS